MIESCNLSAFYEWLYLASQVVEKFPTTEWDSASEVIFFHLIPESWRGFLHGLVTKEYT